MTPVPIVSLLWLLAMLAAIGFGARRAEDPLERLWLAAGFLGGLMLTRWIEPAVAPVGLLLTVAAAWAALWSMTLPASFVLSGLLAALAAGLFAAQGAPFAVAVSTAAGVLLVGLVLSREARFESPGLNQSVFAAIACAALAVAAAPGVIEGWRSAQALNLTLEEPARIAVPAWSLCVVAAAALAGALRGLWGRR